MPVADFSFAKLFTIGNRKLEIENRSCLSWRYK